MNGCRADWLKSQFLATISRIAHALNPIVAFTGIPGLAGPVEPGVKTTDLVASVQPPICKLDQRRFDLSRIEAGKRNSNATVRFRDGDR
jgi:hypothetical protein